MSLQGLNNLKYGLLKEYYYKYCNEISLTHSIPDWYEDLNKYLLEDVDDKMFVRIRLMDYFKRIISRGYNIDNIKNDNGSYNIVSNSKFNNGVIGKSLKYDYECSLESPVYTLGHSGKGTSGHLFKQTSNFILCGKGGNACPYILEPIKKIPFDPDIDPINYTLVDLQTSSHFINEHHSDLNYLNTLHVYILDSNEDGNEVRRQLMLH